MDIAHDSITANDAPPTPAEPPLIKREDYTPFAWLLPKTGLVFDLDLDKTKVQATLHVKRNPGAQRSDMLRLNGDGIVPVSVVVDGLEIDDYTMDGADLVLTLTGESHEIMIETQIDPTANSALMGLYASNGMLCTQCEAEGFRRITFFPDRPDVLSTYSVLMRGSIEQFPVLLCNGNLEDEGKEEGGKHFAFWHDPWPKPSYLFALVAGDLVAKSGPFTTMSGREVECNIWVRAEDIDRTDHALASLHNSMKWDEEVFGREYDLDLYNIVAVSDFNMGAMENKGLNVFNTKYVLADVDTATDADFDGVEGVIAHEYFHNWSGNRITCRDWFQLSLKEGFTVLRDQLFSQDMRGEAVKRIEDVRILRAAQFPEDAGPLAHPIRPDSYREISNFYTATVYNKGAEVIRMMRSMAGVERFRSGTDLYFDRHDGEAATCEDFVKAIEDGAGLDLENFRKWYSTAGTPIIKIEAVSIPRSDGYMLHFKQFLRQADGTLEPSTFTIPLRVRFYDHYEKKWHGDEKLVVLEGGDSSMFMDDYIEPLSVNRGFTAPVTIERRASVEDIALQSRIDDDPFARYEAFQELVVRYLVGAASGKAEESGADAIVEAMRATLTDQELDDSMRGELIMLPSETYLFEAMANETGKADPGAIHRVREELKAAIGLACADELLALYAKVDAISFDDPAGRGARKVKTQVLVLTSANDPAKAAELAAALYDKADNMTDRQGALMVLCGLECAERTDRLTAFYDGYAGNDLVIDKWFTLQALSLHPDVINQVKALAEHPDFTIHNPNRVRSLYMAFAGNPQGFHAEDGAGYRIIADLIIALDPINPQTAARFVPALGRWRRIEPGRARLMKTELERIAAQNNLSRDTYEQVSRSLDG